MSIDLVTGVQEIEPNRLFIYLDKDGDVVSYSNEHGGWVTYGSKTGRPYDPNDDAFGAGVWADGMEPGITDCFPWTLIRATGRPLPVALMIRPFDGQTTGRFSVTSPPETQTTKFEVKDSGERETYANGFVRDTEEGKPNYRDALLRLAENPGLLEFVNTPGSELVPSEILVRTADHMQKGAEKYGKDNWRRARGLVAKMRFARSLLRHVVQLFQHDRSEDHAAAVIFNVAAYELTPSED